MINSTHQVQSAQLSGQTNSAIKSKKDSRRSPPPQRDRAILLYGLQLFSNVSDAFDDKILEKVIQQWKAAQIAFNYCHVNYDCHWPVWPKDDFKVHCKTMRLWLECYYLPLLDRPEKFQSLIAAKKSPFSTAVQQLYFHQVSLFCAPAACAVSIPARLPFEALQALAIDRPLTAQEKSSLSYWIESCNEFQSTFNHHISHLTLKWFARKFTPLDTDATLGQLNWVSSWGRLEVALVERGLKMLSKPLKLCQLQHGRFAKSNVEGDSADFFKGDRLEDQLSFYRAENKSKSDYLIARSSPYFLLRILAQLPRLGQLAALCDIDIFDPLARFIALKKTEGANCRNFTSLSIKVDGREEGYPLLRPLAAFLKQLRQTNCSLDSDLWPLEFDQHGQLKWIFPVQLIPFSFEQTQSQIFKALGSGPHIHWLMNKSGIDECADALACRGALRSACEGSLDDFGQKKWPLGWSREFLSSIEQLVYRVHRCRKLLCQQIDHQLRTSKNLDKGAIMDYFDEMILKAHAESGSGSSLHLSLKPIFNQVCQRHGLTPKIELAIQL